MLLGGRKINFTYGSKIIFNNYYYNLKENQERYQFYLTSGTTRSEALYPFFQMALHKSANPTLASMATIGLVSLPGMVTGQILSGNSPMTAIQYQIMIMLTIFTGTILSVFLSIIFSNRFVFFENNMPDPSI